jgi:thioredoxin reductase
VERLFDAIIVGGGPAGLSAALMLGRCRRRVLVCDSGRYRNASTKAVHGFLTRDGTAPAELLAMARSQLAPYDVELRMCLVTGARREGGHFVVRLEDGTEFRGRKLLLATGMVDRLPAIDGLEPLYGKSVHHCPYCDAWEHRDQPLAAYGRGRRARGLAMSLKTWSKDVVLCTDGPAGLRPGERAELEALRIPVFPARIVRLEGDRGMLRRIVFAGGASLNRSALFFNTGQRQHCDLANQFGCELTARGVVRTDRFERSSVPGLFAVGDCSRNVQFVAVAAAQGTIAAEAMNAELQAEDRRGPEASLTDGC